MRTCSAISQRGELPAAAGAGVVAAPGVVAGHSPQFLGVAGADIAMSHFEPGLLSILRSVPAAAVLVTADRRVIAANTPEWIAGRRLGQLPRAGDGTFETAAEVGADSGWVPALAAAPAA